MDKHPGPDMAAHLPYLDAVADALEAAGLNAGRAEDSSDEWRSGFINIATGPDGDPDDDSDDHFVLCWDWRHGWLRQPRRDPVDRVLHGPGSAGPAEVASAASARLAGNSGGWSMDQPRWNHDPDDDYEEDFAADVKRDLAEFADRQPGGDG